MTSQSPTSAKLQGFWWVVGTDRKVPGTFNYSPADGLNLSLNGFFAAEEFRSFRGADKTYDVVHGQTDSGQAVTLLQCTEWSGVYHHGWNAGYNVSQYIVGTAFVGEHFESSDQAVFQSLTVTFPNLGVFVGVSGIRGKAGGTDDEQTIVVERPPAFVFDIGTLKAETYHTQTYSRTFSGIAVNEEAKLRLTAPTPLTVGQFFREGVQSIHTLLELAVDGVVPVREVEAVTVDKQRVSVIQNYHDARDVPTVGHAAQLPFTLEKLGAERQAAVARWHKARQNYGPTFDLYFSVRANRGIPIEHQFLFLVQALESYHRRAFQQDPSQFKRLCLKRDAVINAAPAEHRKWLKGKLRHAHEPALEQRLKELHESLPAAIRGAIGDGATFAQLMARTRNYLTHFDESAKQGALTTLDEYWGATEQMTAMLMMVFVNTIGLTEAAVLETIWGSRIIERLQRAKTHIGHRYMTDAP
jgi:hypothetical protein